MLRSRASLVSVLIVSTLVFSGVALADQILQIWTDSLLTFLPTGKTLVQNVRPLALQRGVNLDGSMRSPPGIPAAIAGNPFESVWRGTEALEGVRLNTGTYAPFDIDISLPTNGPRWTIGRTFNARQDDGGSFASNGYQGRNWFQSSQPELKFYDDNDNEKDAIYLVYGADRYVEFVRKTDDAIDFKGKNGAAGVFTYTAGTPDLYTYSGPDGMVIDFFGDDTSGDDGDWQLWRITDPDGNCAYIGHATTATTAVTDGFDDDGRILVAYDASGRRFNYNYSTLNSVVRLTSVVAQTKTGGTWAEPTGLATEATVTYAYYGTGDSNGDVGALRTVTLTTPLSDTNSDDIRTKYYRYYTGDYDAGENPGHSYSIKFVVDYEGWRTLEYSDSNFADDDYLTFSDDPEDPDNLGLYASHHFEYDTSRRIIEATFNGNCGCGGGGASGVTGFSYAADSYTATGNYDNALAARTVVARADGTYLTQFFDEAGQAFSQVITNTIPSGSPTKKWITAITRDSTGCVTQIATPASVDTYTNSTGSITLKSDAGLIHIYTRASSTDALGFVTEQRFKQGTGGTSYLERVLAWDVASIADTITEVTLVRPLVASDRSYFEPETSGTSNSNVTSYSYDAWSGKPLAIEFVETTHPAVSDDNNGSDGATTSLVHIRKDGLTDFSKSEDGIITYTAYTKGLATDRIEDADTDSLSPPSGFTTTSGQLDLTTSMSYDAQGRMRKRLHPSARYESWTFSRLLDRRLVSLHYPHSAGGGFVFGPADIQVRNHAGKSSESGIAAIGSVVAPKTDAYDDNEQVDDAQVEIVTAVDVGTTTHAGTQIYDKPGSRVEKSRVYHLMPGSLPGSDGTNYDETLFAYDAMGRQIRQKDATGTITRTVYDELGRQIETWIGTNDYGLTGGEGSGPSNMVKVEALAYDGGSAGGNSNLTQRTVFVQDDSTGQRVTTYSPDLRGRVLLIENPAGPDQLSKYDNLGRVVAVGLYSSTSSSNNPLSETTNRLALSETAYDERGRVWKSVRHKIDATDGSDDDTLESQTWYDAEGRVLKVDGEQLAKTQYDRLGRAVVHYVLAYDDDGGYTDVDDVVGDIVLEQSETAYDASGRVVVQAQISRYHTDLATPTGTLDTGTGSPTEFTLDTSPDVLGRIQITTMWYDDLDRVYKTANYGTNDGDDFAYDPVNANSPDHDDDAVLVTESVFNTDGTLLHSIDPEGLVTQYEYDAAGRRTKVISNWVNGSPSSATADDDQVVEYAYTDGLQTSITANNYGGGDDQVTTYTYGVPKGTGEGDSRFASGRLLKKVQYPESSDATNDIVAFAYNAQGQQVYKRDQATAGDNSDYNIVETLYDTAGRETDRKVTQFRDITDNAVKRISTVYDSLGRVSTVTQYDDASAGDELDQVKYLYDSWGSITNFRQDMDDIVDTSGYYEVAYSLAKVTTGRNTVRRGTETICGKALTLSYTTSGSPDVADVSSRVSKIKDGAVTLVKYDYLGAGQVVGTTYDGQDVWSKQYGSTAGLYPDLDRFNRVVTSRWTKDLSTDVDFYRFGLTYDRDSNILTADEADDIDGIGGNDGHVGFDFAYTMDNLNRLTAADEGTLSGGSITSRTRKQEWTLTQTGDWSLDKLDLNGDGDWGDASEWNDTKTFNKVNEILTRDLDTTPGTTGNNYSLTYDPAGNLTNDAIDYKYEWDAFYRLRKVRKQNDDLVAEYRYNGLGYRIAVHQDTEPDGDVDGSDLWYYFAYDERWRMVATYRSSDSDPKERFFHQQAGAGGFGGSSYIDLVAFREKDANTAWTAASDGLEERIYYCQNQHADVVALVTGAGGQREMDRYSAYGVPFGLPVGDANSSGVADASDRTVIQGWINTPHYDVRGDYDLDGDVDATDKTNIGNLGTVSLGRSALSASAVGNRSGVAGYEIDPKLAGSKYHVRNRLLAPELGNWLRRDPLGYVEGLSLIELLRSNPIVRVDPAGTICLCVFKGSVGKLTVNSNCKGKLAIWVIDEGNAPASGATSGTTVSADGYVDEGTTYKIDGSTCVEIDCSTNPPTLVCCRSILARWTGRKCPYEVEPGTFGGPPKEPTPGSKPPLTL